MSRQQSQSNKQDRPLRDFFNRLKIPSLICAKYHDSDKKTNPAQKIIKDALGTSTTFIPSIQLLGSNFDIDQRYFQKRNFLCSVTFSKKVQTPTSVKYSWEKDCLVFSGLCALETSEMVGIEHAEQYSIGKYVKTHQDKEAIARMLFQEMLIASVHDFPVMQTLRNQLTYKRELKSWKQGLETVLQLGKFGVLSTCQYLTQNPPPFRHEVDLLSPANSILGRYSQEKVPTTKEVNELTKATHEIIESCQKQMDQVDKQYPSIIQKYAKLQIAEAAYYFANILSHRDPFLFNEQEDSSTETESMISQKLLYKKIEDFILLEMKVCQWEDWGILKLQKDFALILQKSFDTNTPVGEIVLNDPRFY